MCLVREHDTERFRKIVRQCGCLLRVRRAPSHIASFVYAYLRVGWKLCAIAIRCEKLRDLNGCESDSILTCRRTLVFVRCAEVCVCPLIWYFVLIKYYGIGGVFWFEHDLDNMGI